MKNQTVEINAITQVFGLYGAIQNTRNERFALVHGLPGVGKTSAALELNATEPTCYLSCFPGWTPLQFCNALANALGLEQKPSLGKVLKPIIDHLFVSKLTLIIDEADYLTTNYTVLETLRAIHDQAQIPIILIGMPQIYSKIRNHYQLVDRISFFVEIKPCDFHDTKTFIQEQSDIEISEDLMRKMYEESSGNPRLLKRYILNLEETAQSFDLKTLTLEQWGNKSFLPQVAQINGGK